MKLLSLVKVENSSAKSEKKVAKRWYNVFWHCFSYFSAEFARNYLGKRLRGLILEEGVRQRLSMFKKGGASKLGEKMITQNVNVLKGSIDLYDQNSWITYVESFVFRNELYLKNGTSLNSFRGTKIFSLLAKLFFYILIAIKDLIIKYLT